MNHHSSAPNIARFTALVAVACSLAGKVAVAADVAVSKSIRVAIYADAGVTQKDVPTVRQTLPATMGFDVKTISAEEIRSGALSNFDVLIHPGGSASKQAETLADEGRQQVRQFVKDGRGFIGICAGAYLASAEYPWALKLLDAHVVDDEHWARGIGEVKLRLPATGRNALETNEETAAIYYENGPLLGPAKKADIPDFESLATFETEIRNNDAPVGVMIGTTAIARGKFGKGGVVCFSPHPEKAPAPVSFLPAAVRWAAGIDAELTITNENAPNLKEYQN